MNVKLIAATQGAGELVGLTAEEIVSYCARVSNPNNQTNFETAPKLLSYCLKHKHYSIFEHASVTLEITTSRAIAAQILRHRSFCFQEFSQRYATATDFELYEARRQDVKNRQNSLDDMSDEDKEWFRKEQMAVNYTAQAAYAEALRRGVAKEQARFLLPLSTQTVLYMTGNLRSWIHYLELRGAASTQKEHRDIALKCQKILTEIIPDVAKAVGWIKET